MTEKKTGNKLQKIPNICSISITPGFSEYVIKTGFKVKLGKAHKPACKIYLPRAWTGGVMFAVCKDPAEPSADPAYFSNQLNEKKNGKILTADPFCNQDICYVYKTVCKQVKKQTDQHGNVFTTELKYVLLPAEWTGKKIICIKALTAEQIEAISDNMQTIRQARSAMFRTLNHAPRSGRTLTDAILQNSTELDTAFKSIAELSPGFRSTLNG